jgi:hypothetical protein
MPTKPVSEKSKYRLLNAQTLPKRHDLLAVRERWTHGIGRQESETLVIVQFRVDVVTGSIDNAGTDADVYLTIAGESRQLDSPEDDFERGKPGTYYLEYPRMTMETLRNAQIILGHDNSGNKPGWYVAYFDLKVRYQNQSSFAKYKAWGSIGWLATDEPDNDWQTQVILQDGSEILPPS